MFKKKPVNAASDGRASDAAFTYKALLAEVDAEEAAAAKIEPIGQGPQPWAAGRRKITRTEAESIKRRIVGPWRKHFTLSERMEFLEQYEVIEEHEPLPIPQSTTHHAEVRAEWAHRAAAKANPKSRIVAAAKVLLGVGEQKPDTEQPAAETAEPPKPKGTFFARR